MFFKMENVTINDVELTNSISYSVQIVMCIIALFVYGIGVLLNIKVFQVTRKEKQMTSKLDETNSIFFIIHYAHVMVMHGITYLVQDLYLYLGKGFCYVSKTLTIIGNSHNTQHSFIIALMKYVMIVHYPAVSDTKKNKLKFRFFILNLLYSITSIAILCIVRPDFIFIYDGISQANRCLGIPEIRSENGSNQTTIKLHHVCNVPVEIDIHPLSYLFHFVQKSICWIDIAMLYANALNVIEMMIYFKIFGFMHR